MQIRNFQLVNLFILLQILTSCNQSFEIPDVPGMTVKGRIDFEGVGVPDVVVSDGIEVTVTNKEGIYYLPSEKKHGYVFISIPGNYEVADVDNIPQFFKRLEGGTTVEQKDFSLIKVDNTKHVVIAMADWHLADIHNDLSQFTDNFLPDVNSVISDYLEKGIKVYGLTLGDMSYETYWHTTGFGLPEYLTYMNKLDCPVYNVIGNHDHDPYFEGDWFQKHIQRDCRAYLFFV